MTPHAFCPVLFPGDSWGFNDKSRPCSQALLHRRLTNNSFCSVLSRPDDFNVGVDRVGIWQNGTLDRHRRLDSMTVYDRNDLQSTTARERRGFASRFPRATCDACSMTFYDQTIGVLAESGQTRTEFGASSQR
jgi:hypothetical protein